MINNEMSGKATDALRFKLLLLHCLIHTHSQYQFENLKLKLKSRNVIFPQHDSMFINAVR